MAEKRGGNAADGPGSGERLTRTCADCGAKLDLAEWCPVVSTTDADGTLQLYSFCDEVCRRAWDGP